MLAAVLGSLPEPLKFNFTMLKGRAELSLQRRLPGHAASGNLFTSSEAEELQRIAEWARETTEWQPVGLRHRAGHEGLDRRSARSADCARRKSAASVDFAKDHGVLLLPAGAQPHFVVGRAGVNHTLFFTLLGGVDEDIAGGILFKNDFVIFDEAHQMENVASRHIGLSVSSGRCGTR